MVRHLVIFLEDGHVKSVAADFRTDVDCIVVSPEPISTIQGEPWIRPVAPQGAGKSENAVITPARIEYLPEVVAAVVNAEDMSKNELLKLLRPAEGR